MVPVRPQSNTTQLNLRRGLSGIPHAREVLWTIRIEWMGEDVAAIIRDAIRKFKNIYLEAIPALSSDRQITHSEYPTCRSLSRVSIDPRRLLQEHCTVADQRRVNIVLVRDPLNGLQRIMMDEGDVCVKGHGHKIIADIRR